MADSFPFSTKSQAFLSFFHEDAKRILGLSGLTFMSIIPVESSINSVLVQEAPLSVDLKIPLCLLFEYKCPVDPIITSLAFCGIIIILPM